MACIIGNSIYTVEGITDKTPVNQKKLIIKVAKAMDQVELCEQCYPKLGEEMSLFFEGITIKINLKTKKVYISGEGRNSS